MRALPMAATGQPAPFRLGAPAYVAALGGWLAACLLLTGSALVALACSAETVRRTVASRRSFRSSPQG